MSGDWKTAAEWAACELTDFPTNRTAALRVAQKADWKSLGPTKARRRKGRGGGWEFHMTCLPDAAQLDYQRRVDTLIVAEPVGDHVAKVSKKVASELGARQRRAMEARAAVLRDIERRVIVKNFTRRQAILAFLEDVSWDLRCVKDGRLDQRVLTPELLSSACDANDRGRSRKDGSRKGPSRTQVYNWFKAQDAGGVTALAPEVTRTKQPTPNWLQGVLRHYCTPSKRSIAHALENYADTLPRPEDAPSYDQVKRAIKALQGTDRFLDAHRGREGRLALKARLGFVTRTTEGLDPTTVYTADGKTFDAMVAHPFHHRPFRPEITTILDVVTRKCVGWSVDLSENTRTVADALRRACESHGIPAIFYTDRGAGYRNDYLDHSTLGLCARLGITTTHSLPYNSQARGIIERVNATIWNKLAKDFPTFMGADMDREAKQASHKLVSKDIKQFGSSANLPSWEDFIAAADEAVAAYNNALHSALKVQNPVTKRPRKASPNETWANFVERGFEVVPLDPAEADDLFRPFDRRRVHRGHVTHNTNQYYDQRMEPFHGMEVLVGYDLFDASKVWVHRVDEIDGEDALGALICVASFFNNKERYVPKTMQEAAVERRAKGRLQRIEAHRQEALEEARPSPFITATVDRPFELKPMPTPVPSKSAGGSQEAVEDAVVVPLPTAERRKPRFADDYELAAHCILNPESMTDNQRRLLVDLFNTPSGRELFELRGGKVDDLRNLLTSTTPSVPKNVSSNTEAIS